MARGDREQRPVVVRRVIEQGHGGHHGGAWKVAYADFVTAMMAFFLLLWLISSASEDTLKGLSEYFNDARVNLAPPGGDGALLDGRTLMPSEPASPPARPSFLPASAPASAAADAEGSGAPEADDSSPASLASGPEDLEGASDEAIADELARRERAMFEQAREAIAGALAASPDLKGLERNLLVDQTPEGLRVQLVDREQASMFPVGSDRMHPHTRRLLEVVARAVADLPNRVSIRGHTDARPYAPGTGYDNWRLSSDRANATRLALVELGLGPGRVADVIGKADSESLIADAPHDPRNRRISLVLLHEPRHPEGDSGSGELGRATSAVRPTPPGPSPDAGWR